VSAGLLYLIGAIGFQIDDTLTTFYGVKSGVIEGNRLFKFLDNGRIRDFALLGVAKALLPVLIYLWSLYVAPSDAIFLLFDFYLEVAVTLWNIRVIYTYKVSTK
jgi:hypothetical protein